MTRNNVMIAGQDGAQPMLFAHGFGCDQHMWRHVAPRFEADFRVVLFDHVGVGGSAAAAFDPQRHASLQGYADDVVGLCHDLGLSDVIFVGHSVSAMIGVLAARSAPGLFSKLVMIGPSPRYIDDPEGGSYVGGFSEADINELLDSLESNYLGWSAAMAPAIIGNPERPELGQELTESFCRADPVIARSFARATFLSDNREDLAKVDVPTLVLQCSNDIIAPVSVGEYVANEMPNATMVQLAATGHCPNLSAPEETAEAIAAFVRCG
ncbi:MAG TPA: alpha/beta hydrolase [Frankiaceae bacterium]|jgi:sigma-B regulation protein RsbQ|nr:alpha/beta hydrolase [Frankiaceae bacterium]